MIVTSAYAVLITQVRNIGMRAIMIQLLELTSVTVFTILQL